MTDPVITRFAPSPTGYLHIGGARTALFNWLFAKHFGGMFYLRIEDTDVVRSTQEAVDVIFASLRWLGLDWDGEVVFQLQRAARHQEVAHKLLAEGKAYYCYCTAEELEAMRALAREEGKNPRYNGLWRNRDPKEAPWDVKPVIRLKAPQSGKTVVEDHVQGYVEVNNEQLDDMVLLRSDGTPTYMLSVVVDDHDMGITHVIRGDDHFTNTFRQKQLYEACGWHVPEFAHIPLIHGPDGSKLSKRHGSLGTEHYKNMGFLPEAMCNYLLRLGWGHGDEEIVPTPRAIELFDLSGIGKSPSRFDSVKLTHLNGHYIRERDNKTLMGELIPFIEKRGHTLTPVYTERILKGMDGLKQRAKTLVELAEIAALYIATLPFDDKAARLFTADLKQILEKIAALLTDEADFSHAGLEALFRAQSKAWEVKLGDMAQAVRIALTGRTVSPSIFEVMEILGKAESLDRMVMSLTRFPERAIVSSTSAE